MKISFLKLISIIILTFAMTDCKKHSVISDKQSILFQLDHVNYAKNYEHYGLIIDNEGNVLTYTNPESWNFPDKDLRISGSQVTENLALCTNTGLKINKEELLKYSGYIKNIAATKITALKNTNDFAGSTEYICYQFTENSNMYKGTIIRMEGEYTCENLNFFSRKVAEWMKNIDTSLPLE